MMKFTKFSRAKFCYVFPLFKIIKTIIYPELLFLWKEKGRVMCSILVLQKSYITRAVEHRTTAKPLGGERSKLILLEHLRYNIRSRESHPLQ